MDATPVNVSQLTTTAKHFIQRLMTVGENRLELLAVEVQEERIRFIHAILLAFGMVIFGLLAGITLTAAVVVLLWGYSPIGVLMALTFLYSIGGLCLWRRLTRAQREHQPLESTRNQLRKDRACLEKILAWTRLN
jgi:uncharacterized membrane protein YqjE